MNAPTAAVLVSVLAVALAAVGGGDAQHAGEPELGVAPNPAPYHLAGGVWQIPDPFAWVPEYAFAQTQDVTPPTFVSSELNLYTGVLSITFSETIDVTPATHVVPTKMHIRESGTYTGGVTLTAGELGTAADGNVISFTLTASHITTVTGLTAPELTIEPGAVQDTTGNLIIGTFDVSTASFVDAFYVASQETLPRGVAFSSNGTKMFVVGNSRDNVNEYTLSTSFDVSTASFVNAFSVASQESVPYGVAFSSNGTKMFVVGVFGDDVNEYTLSTPFDVSTASFVDFFPVASQETNPTGVAFSSDGTKMFVVGSLGDDVNEYTLSTPFGVSTASFVDAFSVASQESVPYGVAFSSDGTKMFVVGDAGDDVNEYTLSTPFDVSTASFVDFFPVASQETSPSGVAFSSDGTKMFVVGSNGDDVNEYTLSSVYPITVIDPFVTTWNTTSANQTVTIPVHTNLGYNYTVIWGDGNTTTGVTDSAVHTYDTADDYKVQIYGTFPGIYLDGSSDAPKLASIDQWGSNQWTSMESAFEGASAMTYGATDAPDLSAVTDMANMFNTATSFNGDISGWEVSGVTDMSDMFKDADAFNQTISGWDVSEVTDMAHMFEGADSFNRPLNDWNVSEVTDMSDMFDSATSFNGDISGWNVSGVTDMSYMFKDADAFNQNISGWNVSGVTDMSRMFLGTNIFSQNISGWDVSGVTNMGWMFRDADAFNQNISGWNVSTVTDMSNMFNGADSFNQPLNGWNVSGVTDMGSMFHEANSFQQNLGKWYVNLNSTEISSAPGIVGGISAKNAYLQQQAKYGIGAGFDESAFEITMDDEDESSLNMTVSPNKRLYRVNVTSESDFGTNNHRVYNVTVTSNFPPTVSAGDDLTVAEGGTLALSGSAADTDGDDITLYSWSAQSGSGITFANASSASTTFTAPAVTSETTFTLTLTASDGTDDGTDTIDVTVKDTSGAFITTWRTDTAGESITIPVDDATGTYDVIWGDGTASAGVMGDQTHPYAVPGDHTVAISGGFERIYLNGHTNATKLASIDQWGSNQWTSMESAFEGASAMTYGATDAPDLSGVTDMSFMFAGASSFNGNISGWDVLGVTDMSDMFTSASSFNGNISGWDVSGVTDMSNMFEDADSFNRPLNGWNVSGVTDMSGMFFGTDIFNQNISGWKVSGVTDMSHMFYEAAFNGDISGWNVSGVTDMSFMFFSADVFNQNISGWDVSEVTNMRSMFHNAGSFNQPLNDWNVSGVTDMGSMFHGASSFRQNLGKWYVNLNSTEISSAPGIVGEISAQNQELRDQYPKYGIGAGFDESAFEIAVDDEEESSLNMTVSPNKRLYRVNVTSENGFGTNNHRILEVTVTGTFDSAAPDPTLSTSAASPTNSASATITVDFGEPIDATTFTLDDISVTGGTASGLAQEGSTTQNYTFTVTPASDGQLTVTILADSVMDLSGNNNTASDALSITFDRIAFSPALSTSAASPTNAASVTVTVDFGEPINGTTFTLDDISVTGGIASGLAQEGVTTQKYTFTVTPSSDGQLTVTIPADRVKDLAGNNNTASGQLPVTFDRTTPGPALSTDAASPTNAASVTVTVDFGKPIDPATFAISDVSVTGGTASSLTHSSANQNFTFTLTPGADGEVTATIPADRVMDIADNSNTASNVLRVTFDRTTPGPALSTDAASPTNAASVTVTVDFGKPIDPATFAISDVSVTGGTASSLTHSSANQNFTFTLTPGADGEVTATIPADRVMDIADNSNTASNVLRVTFDRTTPGPALSTDAASPTNAASVTVTVDFGKPIDPATFAISDVSVTGGTASSLTHSSANQNFTFTLTPGADGEVTATIPADRVMDIADNSNTASNVLRVTFDRTTPGPALSTDAASPTNAASVTVTVDFGKPIDPTTFTLGDISATGGTASNLAHSSANQIFTFTITPDADGEVTASILADRVTDPADNANTASNVLSVTFDRTAPGPTLSTDAASPTNAASVTVTVDFGEPIDPDTFAISDVSVTGGTASNLAHSSANQIFTFAITPDADGEVIASIPADRVADIVGNANTASNILSVVFDRTSPGTTDPTPGSRPNVQCLGYVPYPNNSPVVDVGEDITIAEGETGTLRATVTDMDGDDVETFWVHWKPGTAIITIADPESLVTEFTAPYVDGDTDTYVILHACDGIHTGVGNDVVRITVTDIPEPPEPATPPQLPPPVQEPPVYNEEPSVDAGADFTINEGATGQLSGTATDPDNDQLTMEWLQTPTWPLLTLTDASDPRTTIVAPQVDGDTTITLILSVSDGDYIVPDQVRITIIDTG